MNNRLPYLNIPPPVPGNTAFYANYPPPISFNPATPPPTISPNSTNSPRGKRNRNWNGQYIPPQPYNIPRKPYHKRMSYPRINPASLYNPVNNMGQSWNAASESSSTSDSLRNFPVRSDAESSISEKTDKDISDDMIPGTVVTKKKRKPMSKYHQTKRWSEADAQKALQAEKDGATLMTNQSLIIRFPDPPVNKDMVKEFHSDIENVHFPQAFTPRYCYIHLKEGTDVDDVVKKIETTQFGCGFLKAELKHNREESKVPTIHDIDPYALYVGNLPMNVTKAKVMQYFNTCSRIDIGYPKQMKNSRYAIVGFSNVDDAIDAYKKTVNTLIDSRSMIVRFLRRNKSNSQGEDKPPTPQKQDSQEHKEDTVEKSEMSFQPDLSLVKNEPIDNEDEAETDIKPSVEELNKRLACDTKYTTPLIPPNEIKTEKIPAHINEDEVDDEDEQEEYENMTKNDNFSIANENYLEDDYDDYEDDDDYDVDDEDMCLNMNESNNYLPGDDDDDFCRDK